MTSLKVLGTASAQWATRPVDQRFISLDDLEIAVGARRQRSSQAVVSLDQIKLGTTEDVTGGVFIETPDGRQADLNHWSFGQLASRVAAPAGYLRKLPSALATLNLQWGIEHAPEDWDAEAKLLVSVNDNSVEARAVTSSTYGRIWDLDVVKAVQRVVESSGQAWTIPAASYQARDPKRATTLYASDRDVFLFLVDESHPIELPGYERPKYRGFIVSNSEVGAGTFRLTTFLYDYVCDNRNIWGADSISELAIRHTSGGPARFAEQAAPALRAYSEGSVKSITEGFQAAREFKFAETVEAAEGKLKALGLTQTAAKLGLKLAQKYTDGNPLSAWNLVEGLTEYAGNIEHQDDRFAIEQKAGAILKRAAGK